MPADILFSGIVIAAVTWWIGVLLGRMWTAHEQLRKRVDDAVNRVTRLETLVKPDGDE
jgi:hypothetical protein